MAGAAQRRAQGVLFSFLTIFFVGIAAAAWRAGGAVPLGIGVAAAILAVWMGGLSVRSFRAAREETAR